MLKKQYSILKFLFFWPLFQKVNKYADTEVGSSYWHLDYMLYVCVCVYNIYVHIYIHI